MQDELDVMKANGDDRLLPYLLISNYGCKGQNQGKWPS